MKKALAYALSLALVLSLAACSKPQADQPDSNQPNPAATTDQVDATTPEPEQPTATQLSQTKQGQSQENILQGDELIAIFQHVYDKCKGVCSNEEDQILYELSEMAFYSSFELGSDKQLPDDVVDRYVDWRPAYDLADASTVYDNRFAVTHDTVYATGTVNIREDTSESSKSLGTLNAGDSIERTGIGISGTTAEGWTRCELSNGQVVYVNSSYLSTEKTATQSTSSTSSTSSTAIQAQGGGTPSGEGTPSGGGQDPSDVHIGWSQEEADAYDAWEERNGYNNQQYTEEDTRKPGEIDPRVHVG